MLLRVDAKVLINSYLVVPAKSPRELADQGEAGSVFQYETGDSDRNPTSARGSFKAEQSSTPTTGLKLPTEIVPNRGANPGPHECCFVGTSLLD